jgi:tetratricopeptide (TPR) repeat protein
VAVPTKPPARDSAETFKLAQAIETPIAERAAPAASNPTPTASPSKAEAPIAPAKAAPALKSEPAAKPRADASKQRVEKRERTHAVNDSAEQQFRRAALYLNQGRVSEAEEQLVGALRANPSHVAARQAYVALLLEQKRIDAAQRVLREALAKDPAQPVFSLALARLLAEQHDYPSALDVMDRAGGVSKNADFQAVRGAVMQRLGRHQEAVDAYLAAIQGGVQPATTWVGLGISLEALGRKSDAAQAYRRSLGGALSPEVREYAESRVRALD